MDTKKILIIEDEATMREALQEVLEEKGYSVQVASDGEKGLALISEFAPDLILLDIILPKKDGFDILQTLNEQSESGKPRVPVILLTNISGMENIQKALDLGATTYLVKADHQLEDIAEKVAEFIKA